MSDTEIMRCASYDETVPIPSAAPPEAGCVRLVGVPGHPFRRLEVTRSGLTITMPLSLTDLRNLADMCGRALRIEQAAEPRPASRE